MKRSFYASLVMALVVVFFASVPADGKKKAENAPKYVFYLIGDGMGINEVYGTQIYNAATGYGPEVINFTQFPVRTFVTTTSASSLVTDSSAGGTALATGFKTVNNYMGVDPDDKPLSNLTEWASAKGFGTGVATTVGVNHATPAAFYAHTHSRNSYNTIAEQLIDAKQISFAAGSCFLVESKLGKTRADFEKQAQDAGITVLHGRDQFQGLASHKERVILLAGEDVYEDLYYAIDRRNGETELTDYVKAGIDYLYGNYAKKGFFFMIEGGSIDHAGHNDDAAAIFQEVSDFAKAIDQVLAFYDQHPDETLIVITADHETSGIMLGAGEYIIRAERLKAQRSSENTLSTAYKALNPETWEQTKEFLKENLGMWDVIPVSEKQEASLKATFDASKDGSVVSLYSTTNRVISEAIDFVDKSAGFTLPITTHSGSPVGLYVKGVRAEEFMSCKDNTDVPKLIREVAGY